MASLAEEIQACVLRSFFFDHAMTFERFHRKFPSFQAWLENPKADKIVNTWPFPGPEPISSEGWHRFSKFLQSKKGEEYRTLLQHCPKYTKFCIEHCKRCYLKAEGTVEERYRVDQMYALMICKGEAREAMARRYLESYGRYQLREARKMNRIMDDVDNFLVAPEESQGSA